MSSNRPKKDMQKTGRKAKPQRRPTAATEVQPISPLGMVGAVAAAVLIAAVLLFVINTRLSGSRSTGVAPTPTRAAVAPATTAATQPQPVDAGGGISKGAANAKVTVIEYSDFG